MVFYLPSSKNRISRNMYHTHTLSSSHLSHFIDLDEMPSHEARNLARKCGRNNELGLGCLGYEVQVGHASEPV